MIEVIPNFHPMLVHFPIALIYVVALSYLLGLVLSTYQLGKELFIVSKWCLWFAGGFSILTVYTGWLAYNSVAHDGPSHAAMTLHMYWAVPTASLIILFAGFTYIYRDVWGKANLVLNAIVVFVLVFMVSVTGWLGGEVVYRHGIGVIALPQVSVSETGGASDGHGHNHGNMIMPEEMPEEMQEHMQNQESEPNNVGHGNHMEGDHAH